MSFGMPQTKLVFPSQRPNEKVYVETRRHWWAWVRWLLIPLAMMVVLWVLSAILTPIAPILIFMSFLFPLAIGVYLYADWINDSIIVTDMRIVRITHNILRFSEQVNEIPLTSIQEIQADIPNWDFFARLFSYGFLELRTSGQAGDVKLTMIPDPESIQDLIFNGFQHPAKTQGNVSPAPWSPFVASFPTANGGVIYRKHWALWIQAVFVPSGVILASLVIFIGSLVANLGIIGFGIGFVVLVVGGVWFYLADWDWRHDQMIVNDNTITIIHLRPLWLQNEKDVLLLRRVDNVISESQGFFNQLLNKGTIRFALIGGDTYKSFQNIANPLMVQSELARRQSAVRQNEQQQQQLQQQQASGQYYSMYNEMLGVPRPQPQQYPMGQPTQPAPLHATIQANPYRDANRPPIVPSQRPSLSQGRPYTPPATPFGTSQTTPSFQPTSLPTPQQPTRSMPVQPQQPIQPTRSMPVQPQQPQPTRSMPTQPQQPQPTRSMPVQPQQPTRPSAPNNVPLVPQPPRTTQPPVQPLRPASPPTNQSSFPSSGDLLPKPPAAPPSRPPRFGSDNK